MRIIILIFYLLIVFGCTKENDRKSNIFDGFIVDVQDKGQISFDNMMPEALKPLQEMSSCCPMLTDLVRFYLLQK